MSCLHCLRLVSCHHCLQRRPGRLAAGCTIPHIGWWIRIVRRGSSGSPNRGWRCRLYALLASLSHSGQELSGFGYERGVLVGGADGVSLVRLVQLAKGKKELEQVLQSAGINNKNYVNTIVKRLRAWKREFSRGLIRSSK